MHLLLLMAAMYWLPLSLLLGLGGTDLLGMAPPMGLLLFAGARTFSAAVTLYRVERRSMLPVRAFLRDKKAWLDNGWPRSSAAQRERKP